MTKAEARRIIWKRMAATVRNDIDIGDWIWDEAKDDERDAERLRQACSDVATIIDRQHLRKIRGGS